MSLECSLMTHNRRQNKFRLNFHPFGPKNLHNFNERASDKEIQNVISSTPVRSTRIFPRHPEEGDMNLTVNDTIDWRKKAEWSRQRGKPYPMMLFTCDFKRRCSCGRSRGIRGNATVDPLICEIHVMDHKGSGW